MARIQPIPTDAMTPEQIRVNRKIAGPRYSGPARGPFAVWLRTPEFAEIASDFGLYLRTRTTLPRRLLELTVLITARQWTAHYEWAAHEAFAREAGLAPAVIEDLRAGRRPGFDAADEALVYDVATEIQERKGLGDATYQRATDLLGEQTVIDLLTVIGYYTLLAVVLTGLDVGAPDGGKPLPPLEK
ncbi:MAG: carboxymuconolactone decarboxylase family protein [Alphaproteobacteria bacterium]|nr:carboxymuconolactone decarboxylase family protein [Alphaproteobacteria bacterium]